MLKIIHGADFHLDSPFSGLTPEQAAKRRAEQRQLLADVARLAQATQSDLVLLSGDLLDSGNVYRETMDALSAALSEIPCPVFIAPGNHDFYAPGTPYDVLSWPDNVHIFTEDTITSYDLPQLNCTVWGRAFTDAHMTESPLAGFTAPQDGRTHIMALHGMVGGPSEYGPISPEEIAASGLDYLALGHVHQYSGLQQAGKTWWAYPGCAEGRGFDETGAKGVLYLELHEGQCKARFAPICRHRYEVLHIDLTGEERPLDAILGALPSDTKEDIYRIVLTGEGKAPDLSALERVLAGRFYGVSLLDRTRLPRGLWDRREEDSLTGLFLRLLWERREAGMDDQLCQMAARFGLAALENGEDPYV